MMVLLADAFWSGLAALGFAMLFSVPHRGLFGAVICGATGHMIRTLMIQTFALTIAPATLIGATVVGFMARALAIRLKIPSPVFAISGAIPLVPGVFAYRTMIYLLRLSEPDAGVSELVNASQNAILTGLVLAAIAVGIAAPVLIFERRRPVV